ncbi:MAG: glycosyl transferase [Paludibacteraceae bacterium]|nr:glycosyl transferase [Paludibacteraceae bacterium]
MIPKIIHYCWFGRGQMPELALRCIESWKHYLPDYELRLWNEDTFDLDMYQYAREAYDNRKFAFVTDVVRLWALNEYGGIYMDTDVEVLRSLDDLLELPAFTGYEASMSNAPVTGIMASEAHGIWVREQLAYYEGRHFLKPDGTLDMTTNTQTISRIMQENGFIIDGKYGIYKDNMHIFPVDWFCPLTSTRVLKLTKNTRCIHHFAGSWRERTRKDILKDFVADEVLGRKLTNLLVSLKRKLVGLFRHP